MQNGRVNLSVTLFIKMPGDKSLTFILCPPLTSHSFSSMLHWNLCYSSSEDVEDVEDAGMLLNQFSLAPWSEDAGVPCNGVTLWYHKTQVTSPVAPKSNLINFLTRSYIHNNHVPIPSRTCPKTFWTRLDFLEIWYIIMSGYYRPE